MRIFSNAKLMTLVVAGLGLSCWGLAAFGAFLKWTWSEPVRIQDLGLLVLLVTAGALLLRASEDVNRRLKAKKLSIPSDPPKVIDPSRTKSMASDITLRLITSFTDKNHVTADPLIVINKVIRQDGDVMLLGKVDKEPACIPLSAVNKIKDVETGAVIHENLRTWLNQRLDGWAGKSTELNAEIISKAE